VGTTLPEGCRLMKKSAHSDFDFNYRSPPWEAYQLHCWHSGYEKFGDTFLINVDEFKKQWDIALLEWYKESNLDIF
jgi:hypothetical protein